MTPTVLHDPTSANTKGEFLETTPAMDSRSPCVVPICAYGASVQVADWIVRVSCAALLGCCAARGAEEEGTHNLPVRSRKKGTPYSY